MEKKILDSINDISELKKLETQELVILSKEIRQFLINNISKTGGHLASNLGVVELTIAMHYVFESPKDRIIFDVGHQAYVHKILTGRMDMFNSLRKLEGLSGFPKRNESIHDIFNTGHSSTSISCALGICRARDLNKDDYNVIALIGDGALTAGMAFEALNDINTANTNITIIINDNGMSISKNTGSFSKYFTKLRLEKTYTMAKKRFENAMSKIPIIGEKIIKIVDFIKKKLKYIFLDDVLFEQLGFKYMGTVDGHNLKLLVDVLEKSKNIKGPKVIHVATKKGKGYPFAEEQPNIYHGIAPFSVETGSCLNNLSGQEKYCNILSKELVKKMDNDKKVVAITAAMLDGTNLQEAKDKYPNRVFDVGIAEQHAVTMAAGLSIEKYKPIVCIYSTFLQRAYDQILHDVVLMSLPVIFMVDRAGFVGEDGETHHGLYDIAYLSSMPNMSILSPSSRKEFRDMIEFCVNYNKGPIAIRYPKEISDNRKSEDILKYGKAEIVKEGNDITIVTVGTLLKNVIQILPNLKKEKIDAEIINARFIKPFDAKTISNSVKKTKKLITIEEGVLQGGFGQSLNTIFIGKSYLIKNIGIDEKIISHGKRHELLESAKLDSISILNKIKEMCNKDE